MESKSPVKEKYTLIYPDGVIKPVDLLTFIYLDPFVEGWRYLNLNDEQLRRLELDIMASPKFGKVIPGVGLRKRRFAPKGWNKGKSGATRVIYAYFPEYFHAYMFDIYGKGDQENITPEDKKILRQLLKEIKEYLKAKYGY